MPLTVVVNESRDNLRDDLRATQGRVEKRVDRLTALASQAALGVRRSKRQGYPQSRGVPVAGCWGGNLVRVREIESAIAVLVKQTTRLLLLAKVLAAVEA